jgi:hypothetical protein
MAHGIDLSDGCLDARELYGGLAVVGTNRSPLRESSL